MASGRAAALEAHDALAGEPFLAIGEIAGRAASARILLAAALALDDVEKIAGASIETVDELSFDRASASLRARRRRRLGALTLAEQTLPIPQDDAAALALARGVLSLGVARLPWTKALKQRRDRVMFLAQAEGEAWPDLSDEALDANPAWLAPFLVGKTKLDEISADDLASALDAMLPWELRRRLDDQAPTHFRAPTGTQAPIDYDAEGGPAIALRVQELFGLNRIPRSPADASRSPSICCRPRTGRSRSPAICPASGAARGPRSAPTFAAAIPAISGPMTRPPRRPPPERNRGGREALRRRATHRKPHPAAQRVVQQRRRLAVRLDPLERAGQRREQRLAFEPGQQRPTHIWTPAPKPTWPAVERSMS